MARYVPVILDLGLVVLERDPPVSLGDTSVSAEAAALPNVKGRPTLTGLHVAMTQDPALLQAA